VQSAKRASWKLARLHSPAKVETTPSQAAAAPSRPAARRARGRAALLS